MSITTTEWDSADYLKTEEEMQEYLIACMEIAEDDPDFLVQSLATIARARNMSQLARDTGITREGLSKELAPKGNPSFATVFKVAQAMGMRLTLIANSSTNLNSNLNDKLI